MKILRACFENFRLLHDLELDFSTGTNKRLTVIRAENESGKTTILWGLQWGLYGDKALPGEGRGFRLHPIDWGGTGGESITISVEIDLEVVSARSGRADTYRIVRQAHESVNGNTWKRRPFAVKLFLLGDTGSELIPSPEARVERELPPELREMFFTDGDRALSFIEADTGDKRERVESAIRSLLGLDIIEKSLHHVHQAGVIANREAMRIGSGSELETVSSHLDEITKESAQLESAISDAKEQFKAFSEKTVEVNNKIEDALVKGDKQQLQQELRTVKSRLEQTRTEIDKAAEDHAKLFRSLALFRDLLAPILRDSLEKLNQLREQGDFPKMAIPILEERLHATTCICGESLAGHDPHGQRRREHIEHLIEQSRKSDELQGSLTDLYYAAAQLQLDQVAEEESWASEYRRVVARRGELGQTQKSIEEQLRSLEVQIAELPNTDIQGLRDIRQDHEHQRDRFRDIQVRKGMQLEDLREKARDFTRQRGKLLREQDKGARLLAGLDVIQDVECVLRDSYDRITNEELAKVSVLMNTFFLEMIGSDPEQRAIIQRSEISPEFDILVYGSNDRTLNPDRDLNGASRRALTLAFILALTKVSGVEAPNVIDTPLGMMSGYVKRSVLRTAIRESSQLVLFLTRSEIADCEEILDAAAGRVITLTNPAHYPTMLKNDPQASVQKILRCECDHRTECSLCERHLDPVAGIEAVT